MIGVAGGLCMRSSVTIVSSAMPAPAAFGCCAPDFGSPCIASMVRKDT
jgi:hypothetical protein